MSSISPAQRNVGVRPAAAVRIRPLMPRDHRAIVALDAAITGISKARYWRELFADYGRRLSTRFFFVAEEGARLVGFVAGEIRAWEFGSVPCGWVLAIEVDTNRRLRRIGTMLLQAIVDSFKKAEVRKLRTMLARDDLLNLRFFRSQGMMAGQFIQLEKDMV